MLSMAESNVAELDDLRERLTGEQRVILNTIWHYYCERNQWIPVRVLHQKFGKALVLSALERLGGSIAFESRDASKERYQLTFLGVLLTGHSEEAEELLVRYVEYVRDRFLSDPETDIVTSQEVGTALGLTADRSRFLGRLISLGHFWGSGAGFGEQEWRVGLPNNVDELPSVRDFRAYVRARAVEVFDPAVPVGESQRMIYLLSRRREQEPRGEFWFIRDARLEKLLAGDWEEAQQVHRGRAWKSCVLLCGGIVEGVLLDALGRDEQAARKVYDRLRRKSAPELDQWYLGDLVDVAEERGIFPKTAFHLTHGLRELRNLVHPGRQLRQTLEITEAEGNIALEVVRICLRELGGRQRDGHAQT